MTTAVSTRSNRYKFNKLENNETTFDVTPDNWQIDDFCKN